MKFKSKISQIAATALLVLFALATLGLTGCTVSGSNSGGMTLPNPYYLKDRPEYHPRGPEFPFSNEAAALQDADRQQQRSHGF